MNGSCDMALRYVRDLMGQHAREFVLAASGFEQSGVYADIATREGERVYPVILDNEECEVVIAFIGLGGDLVANFIDVFVDQRVLDDLAAIADIAHDRTANLRFVILGEHSVCRTTHVRELYIVSAGTADENNDGDDYGYYCGSGCRFRHR